MSQNLFSTLFNDGGLKVNATENPTESDNQFRPRFSKGQNKRYEAVIRFLPNPEDPLNKSIISKWSVFLRDPRSNQGKTIDSPSSVGEPDPLSQMFFALRNSTDAQTAKLADDFKRHQRFYSLVQVIENSAEPNTVGKILIWCYGPKIYEKLITEQKPVMQGYEPNQPFDLFKGRLFKVIAVEQSGFNNLDQSMFFDLQYPANCMRMQTTVQNPTTGIMETQFIPATRELAATEQGRTAITNFLTEHAPSLKSCEYKPWTESERAYVNEMITLHQQVLNGTPITAVQQNAVVSSMSVNQSQVPGTPQVSMVNGGQPINAAPSLTGSILESGVGAAIPNPAMATAMPTMGIPTPTPTPMGTPMAAPTMAPIDGLSLGGEINGGQAQVTTAPNISGLNTGSLESIMGTSVTPTPVAAPAATGNLGDLLSDVLA